MRHYRAKNPLIVPVTMTEMMRLQATCTSPAVLARVNRFLSDNRGDVTVTSSR